MTVNTAGKLIELAEEAICTKGYASFSFRELANRLGIKSASVHYHFPTKADLGLAVAKGYRQRYSDALAQIERQHSGAHQRLQALVSIYRQEMLTSQRMTLCCMLAAEKLQLPDALQEELRGFYRMNINWLMQATGQSEDRAAQIFALLQGAFTGGQTLGDAAYFDAAVAGIERLAHRT